MQPAPTVAPESDLTAVERLREGHARLRAELGKAIVGQHDVIDQLLIAMFTRGHALLVGVPGLAKTLVISSLARALDLSFKRVQFTPDLMPSDITGTEVMQNTASGERTFRFARGPIFANIVLADEINRTPPKTQAAMLEAMQERSVTVMGEEHRLPEPFFVLATQNPLEQEGTYPLPEAQLDRFLFMIKVDYPSAAEEIAIMKLATADRAPEVNKVLGAADMLAFQRVVRRMPVADHVFSYAERLVRVTRPGPEALPFCAKWLTYGAGPRASLSLILAAKAKAALAGETHVTTTDVAEVALPVMRHRIALNYAGQSEAVTPDGIIRQILATVPDPAKVDGGRHTGRK